MNKNPGLTHVKNVVALIVGHYPIQQQGNVLTCINQTPTFLSCFNYFLVIQSINCDRIKSVFLLNILRGFNEGT